MFSQIKGNIYKYVSSCLETHEPPLRMCSYVADVHFAVGRLGSRAVGDGHINIDLRAEPAVK